MEVIELCYVFDDAYISQSLPVTRATGSRQHLEKMQCIFCSDVLFMGI